MADPNSSFFNGSILPTNWNWGGTANPASTDLSFGVPDYSNFGDLYGPKAPAGLANPAASPTGLGAGIGLNVGTGQLALGGLSALGSLWSSFQANNLAKQQLAASTSFANTNLTNQIKSYNTSLSDREAARGKTEGLSQDQINSYIAANQLTR